MFFPLPCEWGLPAILCCYLWHSEKMARNLVCRVMSIATPKIRLTGLRCWLMLVGWLACGAVAFALQPGKPMAQCMTGNSF